MSPLAVLCLLLPLGLLPSLASCRGDLGRERYEPRSFLGYACEDDCQRHKAGFRWAERHDVTDRRRCLQLALPEAEGCVAYADEGRDAEGAGNRWAVENEIARPCQCEGAGERFRLGCVQATAIPADPGQ